MYPTQCQEASEKFLTDNQSRKRKRGLFSEEPQVQQYAAQRAPSAAFVAPTFTERNSHFHDFYCWNYCFVFHFRWLRGVAGSCGLMQTEGRLRLWEFCFVILL